MRLNMPRPTLCSHVVVLALVPLAAAAALAAPGPLDPPAGPITSTPGPEPRIAINAANTPGDADSVFRITAPGSYYLTGNVGGVSGRSGIEIASDNVTIDLKGFTLQGVPGSLAGITRDGSIRGNITILNGSVVGWGGAGVSLNFTDSLNTRGFRLEGVRSRANAGAGFVVGDGSVLIACEANQNAAAGFDGANHVLYQNCIATGNVDGFKDGFGGLYQSCIARDNSGDGFHPNSISTFIACESSSNDGDGFEATRCIFTGCSADSNSGWGFNLNVFCHVVNCSASLHPSANGGILAVASNRIVGNVVSGLGAGIRATGADNHIEGNTVLGGTTGFDISGTGNLIIRNSASGSTNRYTIVAGNSAGPVVTSAGMAALTNPAANFDY